MESARAAGDRTSLSAARAASAAGAGSGPECATASFSAPRMRSAPRPAPACRGSRGACGSSTPRERGSKAAWALLRCTALLQARLQWGASRTALAGSLPQALTSLQLGR